MNIKTALREVNNIIDFMNSDRYYFRELGEFVEGRYAHLAYVCEFAETMKAVHTDHDAQAEMEGWDNFFADLKEAEERANGNR